MDLQTILTEMEGELTPELEQRLDTFLRTGKDKLDSAAFVVRDLKAAAKTCEIEAKRLVDREVMYLKDAERLEARILTAVDCAFDGKVKTPLFTIWGQTSAASVGFDVAADADLAEIQKLYPEVVRTSYALDKLELKSMRAQGIPLPNAITAVENMGKRFLRIK
jgi:hypothetical protein